MRCFQIASVLLIILFCSCKKKMRYDLPPNVLFFLIEKDEERLNDSVLAGMKLYYYKDGKKIDSPPSNYDDKTLIFPASRSSSGMEDRGVMCSGYVPNLNAYEGINDFYLLYPDGDVDTIFIQTKEVSIEEGSRDRCYCKEPISTVNFNGEKAPEETRFITDDGKPIYLFKK